MTIGLFSIVVVWHVLPLWVLTLLRRYDDAFSTNVYVKIIVTLYIGIYAIYYARIRGGMAKLSSYRRKKKYKHQEDVFSGDDDFDGRVLRR